MAQTRIVVATTGESYNLPGISWTPDSIVAQLRDSIPALASMASTVTNDPNGDKVVTFTQRTGTKG